MNELLNVFYTTMCVELIFQDAVVFLMNYHVLKLFLIMNCIAILIEMYCKECIQSNCKGRYMG